MRNGWRSTQLGEVAKFINGRAYKQNELLDSGPYPVLRVGNFFTNRNWYYSDLKLEADKYCDNGDLLYAWSASFGPRIWDGGKVIYHYHIWKIEPDSASIDKRYLFHFLEWDKEKIQEQQGAGTTMVHVTKGSIENRPIDLPPLPEQQRIVAILDEAFAGLATATANAEKNLKNGRELFDGVAKSLLQASNEGWERTTLEVLLERRWIVSHLDGNHGSDYPRKEEFVSNGVPYLSANCLDDDSVDISLAKYLSPERAALLRKGIAQNNDVLFAHNATVGPVAMLYTDEPKVILSTSLTYYRCDPRHIVPEYLAHYMRSPEFKDQYEAVMRQSTRNQVPITKQREFFHVIPPLDEQRRIAKKLDALRGEVMRLDAIYSQKLAYVSDLKQSILQKAFSGELTSPPSQAIKEAAE